jgi:hypothetical protein
MTDQRLTLAMIGPPAKRESIFDPNAKTFVVYVPLEHRAGKDGQKWLDLSNFEHRPHCGEALRG